MTTCIFTKITVNVERHLDSYSYDLTVAGNTVTIFICDSCLDRIEKAQLPPSHIVQGLIANGKWPDRSFIVDSKHNHSSPDPADSVRINVDEYFSSINYPKSAEQRLNNLFLDLLRSQTVDGERMYIKPIDEKMWARNYFKTPQECLFYIHSLAEMGFIKTQDTGMGVQGIALIITHAGLVKATELQSEGDNSKDCFIAMAFKPELMKYRTAIKNAIKKTGFNEIVIDEVHLSSAQTIPDAILAAIKKSKFCIADFTKQSHGVYFESGFAVGLGKPVIYTCEEEDFNANSHFDVKQLQHIIYKDEVDLEKRLIDKIEAWIKT